MLTQVVLFFFLVSCCCVSFNEKNNITRTDPKFPFVGEMFTGFIIVENTTQANIFYHLYAFNQSQITKPAPLIIWFEGGPGCSSAFGNYEGFGPVNVNYNQDASSFILEPNPYTWNKYAHLLYIDQPTGTGFSRANGLNVSLTTQASKHFQAFIARFYQLYPEMMNYPLYFIGESYAGKYIPVYTYDLLNNETFSKQVKIKGVAIGNGWSDPIRQLPTYGTFGYAAGMIDARSRDNLRIDEAKGLTLIRNENYFEATKISNGLLARLTKLAGNASTFNYREYLSEDEEDAYADWLNTTKVQNFLNIPYKPYIDCNEDLSDDFFGDNTRSVAYIYPSLFDKIPVLIYNGLDDDNCDYEGTINYINALNWGDIKKFRNSKRVPWKLSDGTQAGLVKGYGNLTFLGLYNSGHLVTYDQPKVAEEMIYNFLNNVPFYH